MSDSLGLTAPANITTTSSTQYSFAMVGDLHLSGNTQRLKTILDAAATEGDEFILFLGDIVDQGTESDVQAFHQVLSDMGWTGKAFSVAGNHDVFYDGWTYYRAQTGSSTYTFTAGNAKFIALDTADGTLGSKQTQWLKQVLSESRPTNLFLFSHYLPVIPGQETYLKISDDTEAINLMALASQSKVTAWFGAHYHSYVQKSIGGVTYLVAGGGGGRRMGPVRDYFFVQASVNGSQITYTLHPVP